MDRLFRAAVELSHESDEGFHRVADHITTATHLWWNPRRPDEPVFWNSTIELGEKFFAEIIACPVPLDMRTLRAMKRSALGIAASFPQIRHEFWEFSPHKRPAFCGTLLRIKGPLSC